MSANILNERRFRAALIFARGSQTGIREAAMAAGCTAAHLRYVLLGERRPSPRLLAALEAYLGQDIWRWVRHETDVLSENTALRRTCIP